MKASSLSLDTNLSFLFKSSPGFGKTLAAASFAMEGPVYLSYWDKKKPIELKTFFTEKRFGALGPKILSNIEYDVFDSTNAGDYLNKIISLTKDCRYFAIINDSLTYMTSAAVNWSLNFGKDKREFKKLKDIIPDWDEYKTETSLVSQCQDLSKLLPCHVIWTAHPIPRTNIDSTGTSIRVVKTNSIVSYGSKVAGLVPGGFTEIYHFSQQHSYGDGKSGKKFIANLEAVGDEFAKSPLLGDYVKEIDFTDRLFYEVWKETYNKSQNIEPVKTLAEASTVNNPFTKPSENKWKT